MIRPMLLVLLICTLAVSARAADAPTTRPAGERVVCFGDSITAKGYPAILGKSLGVETINAGVGGNTTAMALKRIEKDVLSKKPTVVVIFFGTNDSRLAEPSVHVPVEKYAQNLKQMIDQCRAAGARVVLCTPPPIDETAYFTRHKREPFEKAGGLAKVLEQYRSAVVQVGKETHAPVVDLNQLLADDKEWRAPDGVHPTEKGDRTIAGHVAKEVKALLKP